MSAQTELAKRLLRSAEMLQPASEPELALRVAADAPDTMMIADVARAGEVKQP